MVTKCRRHSHPRDVTVVRSIPTTTVSRTLVDVAAVLNADDLARACHEAGVRFSTTPAHVLTVLARRPRSPGAPNLRAVLLGDVQVTLSALERRFLDLLRQHGLVLPVTNKPSGGRYHASRHAWEQDRLREREARARGDDFRRYTYGDVFERPAVVLDELRVALAASSSGTFAAR